MQEKLKDYWYLMRFDKPIGIYLVLWPTLWGVFLAGQGTPSAKTFFIFVLGCILMRAAGCVINDFADRKFDKHVERTKDRPITSGRVSSKEAIILFILLSLAAFVLVLQTNALTVKLSVVALLLAAIYPFTKRFISLPQAWLGIAFGWGIPMAFAAEQNLSAFNDIPKLAWQLLLANVCWAIAYDTMYAMVDKNDDLKIGVKSSALLFGKYDRLIIAILQVAMLVLLFDLLRKISFPNQGLYYRLGLLIAAVFMLYQQYLIRMRAPQNCFKGFLNNHYVGVVILLGIVLEFTLH